MAEITVDTSGGEKKQEHRRVPSEADPRGVPVPSELPILPLCEVAIFPSAVVPLLISRGASLHLVDECFKGDRLLGLVAQENPEDENPAPQALFSRGSAGRLLKRLKHPDGSLRLLVPGLQRIEIREYLQRGRPTCAPASCPCLTSADHPETWRHSRSRW